MNQISKYPIKSIFHTRWNSIHSSQLNEWIWFSIICNHSFLWNSYSLVPKRCHDSFNLKKDMKSLRRSLKGATQMDRHKLNEKNHWLALLIVSGSKSSLSIPCSDHDLSCSLMALLGKPQTGRRALVTGHSAVALLFRLALSVNCFGYWGRGGGDYGLWPVPTPLRLQRQLSCLQIRGFVLHRPLFSVTDELSFAAVDELHAF